MSDSTSAKPIVFISYAHENDDHKRAVAALVAELRTHDIDVIHDATHAIQAPAEGWLRWMQRSIEAAGKVLMVCTPTWRDRFEGKTSSSTGRGVNFEGAIITQDLYDAGLLNKKFFPILPDWAGSDSVPKILRPWDNNHRFPSKTQLIVELARGAPVGRQSDGSAPGPTERTNAAEVKTRRGLHERMVRRSLAVPDAKIFLDALRDRLAASFSGAESWTSDQIAEHFFRPLSPEGDSGKSPAQIDELDKVDPRIIRGALVDLEDIELSASQQTATEAAAASLYWMAAARLVERAALRGGIAMSEHMPALLCVPGGDQLVCAIIAAKLYGGRLKVVRSNEVTGFAAENTYCVRKGDDGDASWDAFLRALYHAVFPGKHESTSTARGSGALSEQQLSDLEERLRSIREVENSTLALVVEHFDDHARLEEFGATRGVPILTHGAKVARQVLAIPFEAMRSQVTEFERQLAKTMRSRSSQEKR